MTMQHPGVSTSQTQQSTEIQPRTGIMLARIGSQHMVRGANGEYRQHTTADLARHPGVATHAVCFARECRGKTWATIEACVSEHPADEVMRRQGEVHVVALWSNAPADATVRKAMDAEKDREKREALADGATPIGLLSGER